MNTAKRSDLVRIDLTQNQQRQLEQVTGRAGDAIELTVQELEERIAPRLGANHNAPLLADV